MFVDLPNYPQKQASGIPWAPILPAAWGVERGKTLFKKVERPIRPDDGVVTCFRDGVVTLRSRRRTSGFTESLKEVGYQGIRKGDLVIHAMDAFAGAAGVSDSDGKSTPVYSACVPRADANPHYFAAVIREMARTSWVMALSKGIRERSTDFRFETFGTQMLPVPPAGEQAAIVKYLAHANSRIDKAITSKRRLIALLEEQERAIVREQVMEREVNGWPLGRLGRLGNGSTPSRAEPEYWLDGTIPWLNSSVVNLPKVDRADQFVTARALDECHLPIVRADSVLIGITGQGKTRGLSTVLRIEATINQHLIYLTPDARRASADYVALALRASYEDLRRISDGSGGTKGALTIADLKSYRIPLPPLEQQARVVMAVQAHTKDTARTIERVSAELGMLREFRARLVADVVTGQVDVRQIAAALPDLDQQAAWVDSDCTAALEPADFDDVVEASEV